jgi:serine protease
LMGLTALLYGSKTLRPIVGGLAIGAAALLVQQGISGESFYALGPFALRIWCAVNAIVCVWIARMTIDTK